MASTAAIVFVKNDADDIGWWIAHHLAVGFDSLVIIDDHSTDGTWDVIQNAAAIFPIEARRAPLAVTSSYAERRSDAYGLAIDSCRDRFDWVICLESDEYVHPEAESDIASFLSRFDQADAIMLHWSIFGSNGHVTHPVEAPTAAYTRRAPLDFADHALGKTFIRPGVFDGQFIDGCHWTIAAERYYRADGELFVPGAPAAWGGARILHYVTRSLSQYTRRLIQQAPSGQAAPDLWSHFNRNEVDDHATGRFLATSRECAARLGHAMLNSLYWRVRQDIQDNSLRFVPDTAFTVRDHRSVASPSPLRFASLITVGNEILAYDPEKRHLALLPVEKAHDEARQVLLVVEDVMDQRESILPRPPGFLLLPDTARGASVVPGACLTHWVPVQVEENIDTTQPGSGTVALFFPANAQWLACDVSGELTLDVQTPLRLAFHPVTPSRSVLTRIEPYLALRSHGDTLHDFCTGLDMLRAPHADALACALTHLPAHERDLLRARYAGLVPSWLASA